MVLLVIMLLYMNPEILNVLECILWAWGIISGIFAAWFKLRSIWLSKPEDRQSLQAQYRLQWQIIRDKRFLELPERGVRWLLYLKGKLKEMSKAFGYRVYNLFGKLSSPLVEYTTMSAFILIPGAVSSWILYGMTFGITASVVGLIVMIIIANRPDVFDWIRYFFGFLLIVYLCINRVRP